MIYETLLFDLDGTLTDPGEGITKSVQYALRKLGIDEDDRSKLAAFIGPPLTVSFREFYGFDDAKSARAVSYYREYFAETGIFQNEVYPEIPALLDALVRSGRRLVLATSKPAVFAVKILDHFSLSPFFSAVYGSELDGRFSDKSELIAKILSAERFETKTAVMTGDRKHDIIAAKNNGLDSAAVAWGYGSTEELDAAAPTYLVRTVADLAVLFGMGKAAGN